MTQTKIQEWQDTYKDVERTKLENKRQGGTHRLARDKGRRTPKTGKEGLPQT
jgi:hypothetical protein